MSIQTKTIEETPVSGRYESNGGEPYKRNGGKPKLSLKRNGRTGAASKVIETPVVAVVPVHSPRNPSPHDMTDDELLMNITALASECHKVTGQLRDMVELACDFDLDRKDVVDAIVEGGWTENYSRQIVSNVWRGKGKIARKTNPDNKPGKATEDLTKCLEAVGIAKSARQRYGEKAIGFLKKAIRLLEQHGERVLTFQSA